MDGTSNKRELLAAELLRYFGETCPTLMARWESAIVDASPPLLLELVEALRKLDAVTSETNIELRAVLLPAAKSGSPAEPLLDRAIASIEHLQESAVAMMRRLDELLMLA